MAGAGVGLRFLNFLCELQAQGADGCRLPGRKTTTIFHTSHPQLAAALRRDKRWRQLSAALFGGSKVKSRNSVRRSQKALHTMGKRGMPEIGSAGYGGHFRAVQGFRYYGEAGLAAAKAPA